MYEIRDPELARVHLLHGLLISRVAPLSAKRLTGSLRWAKEVAGQGWSLPPLGFVADVGELVTSHGATTDFSALPPVAGLEHTLTRRYEDYVLGKLSADPTFQRGVDAVLQYEDRDRDRAIAYLVERLTERAQLDGVQLSPAVIDGLLKRPAGEVLREAWAVAEQTGLSKLVIEQTEQLITAIRNSGQTLGPEDLFELETGIALVPFGQRVALRQVLRTAEMLQREIPQQRPRSSSRRYSVATNLKQEDQYPIGGFTSIANRGTIESLVRSELAYMEQSERPDLFDIKYARNELLYYSRDENQFLRRRMSFVFVFYPDLIAARVKDSQLPVQRIILLLGCVCVTVRHLLQWMSEDALTFEFLWVNQNGAQPLDQEQQLIETIFHEQMALGTVHQESIEADRWHDRIKELGRITFCQSLIVSTEPVEMSGQELPPNAATLQIGNWDLQTWQQQLLQCLETWCV